MSKKNAPATSAAAPFSNPYLAGVLLGLVLLASFVILGAGLGAGPGAPDVAGRRLFDALTARAAARLGDPPLRIVPVECLSACSHPTAVALARAGRWGYVYGDLGPAQLDEILDGGALYADAADGVVEWRLRPQSFQSGVVARIPPTK